MIIQIFCAAGLNIFSTKSAISVFEAFKSTTNLDFADIDFQVIVIKPFDLT